MATELLSRGRHVRCPYCLQTETRVVDSRELPSSIRRRRECMACKRRFTTYEEPREQPLVVIKRDARRESFDRGKLITAMRGACHKRPVSLEQIERVATEIEGDFLLAGQREIPSRDIGEKVMQQLKRLDEIAFVRFASVYRSFRDVDTLAEEIDEYREWRQRAMEARGQIPLKLD